MTQVMTPSSDSITAGQIGKFQELLGARLRKSGLLSEPVQQVLANQGDAIADEMVAAVRKRVETISGMIVRRVKVNRTCTSRQALEATGRKQYTNKAVVDSMPQGEGDEVDIKLFKPDPSAYNKNGWISDDDLQKQYDLRGLKPDPRAQAAANEADPAFADERPNGTHWKKDGKWYFAAFGRWRGERFVDVYRYDYDWDVSWWFAGVSK